MNHQVQIFEIARDAKPTDRARPIGEFAITADTQEEARDTALARLRFEGRMVRALSFLAGGGLAAIVTQPAPAPSPSSVLRARRGR